MTFRSRLALAFGALAVAPLLVLALGVQRDMARRLTAQDEARADAIAALSREELAQESRSIALRLAALADALADDNRFRLATVQGDAAERPWLLDYAGGAMRLAGLSMLQIQDSAGRILSSGHFRNEYDRLEPDLPPLLAAATGGAALVRARTPAGPLLVLARTDSLHVGGRRFTLVGGMAVDAPLLRRLSGGGELALSLHLPDTVITSDPLANPPAADAAATAVAEIPLSCVCTSGGARRSLAPASLVITRSTSRLTALRASLDRWLLAVIAASVLAALAAAYLLSARVSRPLRALAERTAHVDLDRLDVEFPADRRDEIGALARLLNTMTARLRASAVRLRDVERRAVTGDLARQVNHDIKNGLTPIRHVLRHLEQVERDEPERLAAVFAERRATLDASVEYLDTLARNYARLTPRLDLRPCDVNAVARAVAAGVAPAPRVTLALELEEHIPAVAAEPLALRRILENLVTNAIDAVDAAGGTVTIATEAPDGGGARVTVTDTGSGMTRQQLDRAFDDFQTTKPGGTGLGLSIVRRLVADLGATLRVETEPGAGTRVAITFPPHQPAA